MQGEKVDVGPADWSVWGHELREVRRKVFINEQGVAPELEWDGLDGESYHFIATTRSKPSCAIGTARLMLSGQIGRMAVLPSYRERGIGRMLLDEAVLCARNAGFERIFLHAQVHARKFYERAGFRAVGDEFREADIAHIAMEL